MKNENNKFFILYFLSDVNLSNVFCQNEDIITIFIVANKIPIEFGFENTPWNGYWIFLTNIIEITKIKI